MGKTNSFLSNLKSPLGWSEFGRRLESSDGIFWWKSTPKWCFFNQYFSTAYLIHSFMYFILFFMVDGAYYRKNHPSLYVTHESDLSVVCFMLLCSNIKQRFSEKSFSIKIFSIYFSQIFRLRDSIRFSNGLKNTNQYRYWWWF